MLPPTPVQVSEYLPVPVSAPVGWVPEVALAPDQLPDALHAVAFVEDQVSVAASPLVIAAGLATSDTVGCGTATVTVADALALPPVLLHVSEKLFVLALSAPVE